MILLGIILFLTVFEAVHEGLKERGLGTLSGIIEMVKLTGMALIIAFLIRTGYFDYFKDHTFWFFVRWFVLPFFVGWAFVRYALFDYIHNLCAGWELDYIGKTKLYDRFWRWALQKQDVGKVHRWSRVVYGSAGIAIIIRII